MPKNQEESMSAVDGLMLGDPAWIIEEMRESLAELEPTESKDLDSEIADTFGAILFWSYSDRGSDALKAWLLRQKARGRDTTLQQAALDRIRFMLLETGRKG
jgi:hypothetical protein